MRSGGIIAPPPPTKSENRQRGEKSVKNTELTREKEMNCRNPKLLFARGEGNL